MSDLNTRADALDEQIQRMRKELDAAKSELDQYAVLNPQQCPKGIHADWMVDSEYTHACPWCALHEAVRVSETLSARLHEEVLAGSALYAALTMPTTPEELEAALAKFRTVARKEGGTTA
jgi:hypothetical protein